MRSLGYDYGGVSDSVPVRRPENNLLLYRLMFFSRNALGGTFWKNARRGTDPQTSFDY